jgi:aspartyl-tRNA(Asn)/glutamyl-tRNA(Gln) amidotransferase subunit A
MHLANDVHLTIANLHPLVRRRRLSPVELTDFALARIERLDPQLNAFITVTADLARAHAREAEKEIAGGRYRGPLHGIPVCLKDLFFTRDIRTTAGSLILRRFRPRENACVVDRLIEAGAVVIGKTNLHEFAFGATNVNPHYGPVQNPWLQGYVPGGSSGGSAAAVAAALAVGSLGTDTGGSIRIPAAACGCVGLKPTYGRLPLHGVIPLSTTLDHAGPITRCVEDAAIMLEATAGADPRDPSSTGVCGERFTRALKAGLKGLRVGVPRQYFFDRLDSEVKRLVLQAISTMESSGAELREINLQHMPETPDLAAGITIAEAMAYHWDWFGKRPGDYGNDLRTRMNACRAMTAVEYIHALRRRGEYRRCFMESMEGIDVLAAPTLPITAPPIEAAEVVMGKKKEDVRLALLRLTRPGNLTGLPAISAPCGFSSKGLPAGLQLIGRPMDESTVLRAAWGYEQATDWHCRFPME